jgi:hypothetical protein
MWLSYPQESSQSGETEAPLEQVFWELVGWRVPSHSDPLPKKAQNARGKVPSGSGPPPPGSNHIH